MIDNIYYYPYEDVTMLCVDEFKSYVFLFDGVDLRVLKREFVCSAAFQKQISLVSKL